MRIFLCLLFFAFLLSACGRSDYETATDLYKQGDYQAAFDILLPLAESGDAQAQNTLGVMYENEDGIGQDYIKAFEWYQKAAEQEWVEAQYQMGLMYQNGLGVEENPTEAAVWYLKAAEQNFAIAQIKLAKMYLWVRVPLCEQMNPTAPSPLRIIVMFKTG